MYAYPLVPKSTPTLLSINDHITPVSGAKFSLENQTSGGPKPGWLNSPPPYGAKYNFPTVGSEPRTSCMPSPGCSHPGIVLVPIIMPEARVAMQAGSFGESSREMPVEVDCA